MTWSSPDSLLAPSLRGRGGRASVPTPLWLLSVSGFKVYSVHVEDVLTKHPAIQLCAIIGIPNPDRPGAEIVKAVIQLKEGTELNDKIKASIQEYANENLAKYEIPKIWEFSDELPTSMVGKVLKRALREE